MKRVRSLNGNASTLNPKLLNNFYDSAFLNSFDTVCLLSRGYDT